MPPSSPERPTLPAAKPGINPPALLAGGILLAALVAASFFPESSFWGFNHLAFVPETARHILAGLSVLVMLAGLSARAAGTLAMAAAPALGAGKRAGVVRLLLAAASFALFTLLRIQTDMYGDTRSLLEYLSVQPIPWTRLFDISDAEPLTRIIHQRIAAWTGLDLRLAYQLLSCLAGGVFAWSFLGLLAGWDADDGVKTVFMITGFALGANQLFYGHVEDYTLAYAAILSIMVLAWRYFDGRKTLFWMLLVWIVGLRLHAVVLLTTPGILYIVAHDLVKRGTIARWWAGTRAVAVFSIVSGFAALGFYALYFRAYGIEDGTQEEMVRKIFLPVINPVPMLNGYTLQSWMHLNDVVQLLFQVCSPALIFLLLLPALRSGPVRWTQPRTIFFGLSSAYFLLFTFTMNPILSMPRDWDLLSAVAGPLLFLAMSLSSGARPAGSSGTPPSVASPAPAAIHPPAASPAVATTVLALTLVSAPLFWVNSSLEMASRRIRSVGVWVYHSYHRGSAYLINVGCKNIGDPGAQIAERRRIIGLIEPEKIANDPEFSFLFQKLAETCYANGDPEEAEAQFRRAIGEYGGNSEALKRLGFLCFRRGKFDEGTAALDRYNREYNDPVIQDRWALVAAEYGHYLVFLRETGVDPARIADILKSFDPETR